MLRAIWIAMFMLAAAIGCGGDDSSANDASRDAAASCATLSGTWTIASHCSSALVGTQVMVAQSGCTVTTSGAFPGFTGEIASDGSFGLTGSASGMSVTCSGSATEHTITESCTGSCNVTLTH